MAFDGLFIHSLLKELTPKIESGRLSKIYQPFNNDIVLVLRKDRKNQQLLLSANPEYPRVYLTKGSFSNPEVAPLFVMVLRKYLEGSILRSVSQVGLSRIINFRFSNRNELGDEMQLVLSIELMGKHSNIILYNEQDGKIIDLLKRINPDENRARLLLPKATYELPPLIPGKNGLTMHESEFKALKEKFPNPSDFAKQMDGLDGDDRKELIGYLEDDFSYSSFKTFFDQFENPRAFVLLNSRNKRRIYTYLPYHLDMTKESSSNDLNEALDEFYSYQERRDWVKQRSQQIERVVTNERKKLTKKVKKLNKQLNTAEDSESLRISGELLTAYLNQVKPGMTSIDLPNYYENNAPLTIKLDPALSPQRNAQKYFKRYKKMRDSIKHVKEQIEIAEENLQYLDSVQTEIDNADPEDIEQIKEELIAQGYLRQTQKKRRRHKISEKNLNKFKLSSGKTVLVGKNNLQNDWLTLKKANKTDYWFHVKNIPGSHVILQDDNPSDEDIKETAEIAAYFSKGKNGSHVQVDYIQDKRIKKPHGAKPGFVIYTGQNSIEVTPVEDEILSKRIK